MSLHGGDVVKTGYLVKLKTNKKKFFVLRKENESSPAQLEYYDSEKKYKASASPKRAIILKHCFNINKKTDCKQKHVIAIYTKEDCFSLQCRSDEEHESWLEALLDLHNEDLVDGQEPRPFFEHIWQVTVKPRGLGNGKNLSAGLYRLCLTNKTLSLVRVNQQEPDIVFQLASLRRCGHSDCFFFMEAGSSAVTGAGELWMQVEDTVIARNIHETILISMKTGNLSGDPGFRQRSQSSVSDTHRRRTAKPISVPPNARGGSPGYDSATLPKRSKTISGEHPSSPRLRPGSKSTSRSSNMSSLGRGPSPVTPSPLSQTLSESIRSRTDSMESRGSRGTSSSLSADEYDLSPHDHHSSSASTRSVTPEGGAREEANYIAMSDTGVKAIMVSPSTETRDEYMSMAGAFNHSREQQGYMDMSPGDASYLDMHGVSLSSSPGASTISSEHDPEDHGYLDMACITHSLPTVQEKTANEGYLDMSQGSPYTKSGAHFPKPDRVFSYLSDDQSSACSEDFPIRAYSVGSKPAGAGGRNGSSYMDMSGTKNLDKAAQKSCSAPHLLDKPLVENPSMNSLSAIVPNRDLLMEFDFHGRDSGDFRPRTHSTGKDFRPRVHSAGKEMRRRAASFGKDSHGRTGGRGDRGDRPRTSSMCQDAFRNRTSSFGSTCDRPRSSSYGSRAHYKSHLSEAGSRHSSQESVRRSMQRATEDLRAAHDVYIDMNRTPSPRPATSTSSPRLSSTSSPRPLSTASPRPTTSSPSPRPTTSSPSPRPTTSSPSPRPTISSPSIHPTTSTSDPPILSVQSAWREDEYFSMTPGHDLVAKDNKTIQRRFSMDSMSSKPTIAKTGKQWTKPSTKHSHRVALRMPSSESISSTQEDCDRTSPGEYIDLGFGKDHGKSKPHGGPQETRVPWTCNAEGYAVFSPEGSAISSASFTPTSPAVLDPIMSPIRLDEGEESSSPFKDLIQPSPASRTSVLTSLDASLGPLHLTPEQGTISSSSLSDPFNLIASPSSHTSPPTPASAPAPASATAPPTTDTLPETYVQITRASPAQVSQQTRTSTNTSKTRISPVLPPKIKSKSKKPVPKPDSTALKATNVHKTTVALTIGSTTIAELDYMDCTAVRQQISTKTTDSSDYMDLSGAQKVMPSRTMPGAQKELPKKHGSSSKKVSPSGKSMGPTTVVSSDYMDCSGRFGQSPATLSSPGVTERRHGVTARSTPGVVARSSPLTPAPFDELLPPAAVSYIEDDTILPGDVLGQAIQAGLAATQSQSVAPPSHLTPELSNSTSSLTDQSSTPVLPSRGSTTSLPGLDNKPQVVPPMRRLSRPCDQVPEAAGDIDLGLNFSQTSIGSGKELNYAELDLASSLDENSFPSGPPDPRTPRSPLPTKVTGSTEDLRLPPVAYAEIDFNKSEELRTATAVRDRPPFDVK